MNIALQLLNLISKDIKTQSTMVGEKLIVSDDDGKQIAVVQDGVVSSLNKDHIRHSLSKRIYAEQRQLSKFWGEELVAEFNQKTNGLVERVLDQNNPLSAADIETLNKLI